MSTTRAPCPNCQLPYYTARNDTCPYCGTQAAEGAAGGSATEATAASVSEDAGAGGVDTTPAGSVRQPAPPSRPREACQECGLPYYADDADGCPYCDADGVDATAAAAEESSVAHEGGGPEPTAAAGAGGSEREGRTGASNRSGGLVSRILGLLGR